MNRYIIITLLSAFTLPVRAYDVQKNTNNIQTITYIQGNGSDSLVSVQFYDTYGRPTSAGRTGLTSGDQIYSSQSYDCLGRNTGSLLLSIRVRIRTSMKNGWILYRLITLMIQSVILKQRMMFWIDRYFKSAPNIRMCTIGREQPISMA